MDIKVKNAYKKHDFDVEEIKGNSRFGKHMVAVNHDGVQYAMDDHGNVKNGQPDIEHTVNHLKIIIKYHHDKIKKIYEYLVAQNIGDIWIMSGGGAQVQAFFGNHRGYIAVLHLDMDKKIPTGKTTYTLSVNGKYNDQYFDGKKSKFSQPKIKVSTHKETYGRDEEEDEDYDLIYGY